MLCGVLSSIPALYPLSSSSTHTHTSCDNQKCLQILPNVPWGTQLPHKEPLNKGKGSRVFGQRDWPGQQGLQMHHERFCRSL